MQDRTVWEAGSIGAGEPKARPRRAQGLAWSRPHLGLPKVANFDGAVAAEHHVFWLHIAVHLL